MRATRNLAVPALLALLVPFLGCATRPGNTQAGVAPEGTYGFAGLVDGEEVDGTLEFSRRVVVSSSHGICERRVRGMHHWTGRFTITCPDVAIQVIVNEEGELLPYGFARLRREGVREERTTCRQWNAERTSCLVWNTAPVLYDRWVRGRVAVASLDT